MVACQVGCVYVSSRSGRSNSVFAALSVVEDRTTAGRSNLVTSTPWRATSGSSQAAQSFLLTASILSRTTTLAICSDPVYLRPVKNCSTVYLEAWRRHQLQCSRHTQIFPHCAAYVLETCSHHFPVEQTYLITYVFSALLVIWRAVSFPRWYRNVELDDFPWRNTSVHFALFDAICYLMPFCGQGLRSSLRVADSESKPLTADHL